MIEDNLKIWTKSSTFILPMLDYQITEMYEKRSKEKTFINCYIGDLSENRKDTIDNILLLFEWNKSTAYENLIDRFKKNKNYLYSYNPNEINILDMHVFCVPDQYAADFKIFKAGKYSKFSSNFKRKILESLIEDKDTKETVKKNETFKILLKKPERKVYIEKMIGALLSDEDELYDIPIYEDEMFNIDKFKQKSLIKE